MNENKIVKLRSQEFNLPFHHHGKARVRVLKVRRAANGRHSISEYTVHTKLFSPAYAKVYNKEDNSGLVATDTQKNTVYVVAKRTNAATPEEFAIDLCKHFITEYPVLTAVEVDVKELPWNRAVVSGQSHDHAFVHPGKEAPTAKARLVRSGMQLSVTSSIESMIILKSTQSGFDNYLKDKYTLLPETDERCLSTELTAEWTYMSSSGVDYAHVRKTVREQLLKGLFGPSKGGVFSVSLQATIYDAGCLVLSAAPDVKSIEIDTPNIHYLPMKALHNFGESFEDDIFMPTCEPSGSIHCIVSRDSSTPTNSKL